VIGIAAHRREDHWNGFRAEVPACRDASRIVVHPADCDVAIEIDSSGDRFLEPQGVSADFRFYYTFRPKIPRERKRFVLADILYIEALPVEVAGLDYVVIQQRDSANAFAHQGGRDL
jgi:hypothetical protein